MTASMTFLYLLFAEVWLSLYLDLVFFFFNFYYSVVALQCCVSFCCAAMWISCIYTHIPYFFNFHSIYVTTEHWVEFPILHSRFSLVIHFINSSVYVLIPVSQFTPPPFFPLWCPYACYLFPCLSFCFANRFICTCAWFSLGLSSLGLTNLLNL